MGTGKNAGGVRKQHKPRSQVQKNAHNAPRSREAPKVRAFAVDKSRTTFGKLKNDPRKGRPKKIPKSLEKGQFEKLAGTRIQLGKGGVPVRVVIESGKEFAPEKVGRTKQHLAKLREKQAEKDEIARIRGDDVDAGRPEAAKVPAAEGPPAAKKPRPAEGTTAAPEGGAPPRPQLDGRFSGTVLERNKKIVWVKLCESQKLPLSAAVKLDEAQARRKAGAEASKRGGGAPPDGLPVKLLQKADKALSITIGNLVTFKLQEDAHGVSGSHIALGGAAAK